MTAITRRALLAGTAAAIGSSAIAQNPMRWRFAHPHPESDSWQTAALRFAELVKDRTKGAIEIQVFPNGVLGNDPTTINAVRGGSLDIALTGNPFLTGLHRSSMSWICPSCLATANTRLPCSTAPSARA